MLNKRGSKSKPAHAHMRKSHSRIVIESITYTSLVIFSDAIVIALITKDADQTIMVLIATNLASFALYYIHAHIWNQVRRGHRLAKARARTKTA